MCARVRDVCMHVCDVRVRVHVMCARACGRGRVRDVRVRDMCMICERACVRVRDVRVRVRDVRVRVRDVRVRVRDVRVCVRDVRVRDPLVVVGGQD